MSTEPKRPWTIGQYVFMAGLSALIGAALIVGGSSAGVVVGAALVAVAAGLGLVAVIAKANTVDRS